MRHHPPPIAESNSTFAAAAKARGPTTFSGPRKSLGVSRTRRLSLDRSGESCIYSRSLKDRTGGSGRMSPLSRKAYSWSREEVG